MGHGHAWGGHILCGITSLAKKKTKNLGEETAKRVKGINCMVTDGNRTFGGEHPIVYTEVKI